MIRFEGVSKTFPGAAHPSVDRLDLEIPSGEIAVLIGPSGCGKTTTMRMVNRLIEPSAGRILVDGDDVLKVDPVQLRRRIGYVIQQVGLFPHMTIAENVATVPKLLGWPGEKVRARVAEMLDLVGLDPAQFLTRKPRHLSGGQRQRVGVARALAADPPLLLMDEPFGAVDPIVRARLQDEFIGILKRLKKTVILVTHDIDEAVRMGTRVAIIRDGRLVQVDTPDRLLAHPADPFVAEFVGADRGLKRLAILTAGDMAAPDAAPADAPTIPAAASVRDALSVLLAAGADAARVVAPDGGSVGVVTLAAIRERAGRRASEGAASEGAAHMKVIATRDDVHPGDAAEPRAFEIADGTPPEEILRAAADRGWLPSIHGDRATWAITSNGVLAVMAYEWADLECMSFLDERMKRADRRDGALHLHFSYITRATPEDALMVLSQVRMHTLAPSNAERPDVSASGPPSADPRAGTDGLSRHILPSAGTMIGVCTTLIGLVKLLESRIGPSHVDEAGGVIGLVFLVGAFASYLSIRSAARGAQARWLERIADAFFMVGIVSLSVLALLFAYETI